MEEAATREQYVTAVDVNVDSISRLVIELTNQANDIVSFLMGLPPKEKEVELLPVEKEVQPPPGLQDGWLKMLADKLTDVKNMLDMMYSEYERLRNEGITLEGKVK